MFTHLEPDSSQLVDKIFFSGICEEFITKLISDYKINNKTDNIYPEILFSYPQDDEGVTSSILEYIFTEGISIEFNASPPKFIPVALTNEKGVRSYVYSIRLHEKIEVNHKIYYLPFALSIWSQINNCQVFKKILTEFYRIMKMTGELITDSEILNYHNLEIIHIIIFLTNIILPPNKTKIVLNFHFSSVEFETASLNEIPNNEEYIRLLFDCLEITTIIKLWCSILSEKHIIFLSNQGYLLFAITQGLLSLMFPFCWLHTYIPVLPNSQIDYLDSPTPYLIGVISTKIDYQTLNEKYPGHVICDLNTSTINKNAVSFLSSVEEDKIKKKIRLMNNPKMFEEEDIYIDEEDKKRYSNKNFELEDVDTRKSFGENIHYIFFRIFRYPLSVIQSHFIKNKVFDVQTFLEDYCQDEMRDFWDKLTSTVAFDTFLMNLNNIDEDPLAKIFLNILSTEKEENNYEDSNNSLMILDKSEEILTVEYNLPNNLDYIFNQFIEVEDTNDDYCKAISNLKSDYTKSLYKLKYNQQSNIFQKKSDYMNTLKETNQKKNIKNKINNYSENNNIQINKLNLKHRVSFTLKYFNYNNNSKEINNDFSPRRTSINCVMHKPTKNLFQLYGQDTIRNIEQQIIRNQLVKLNRLRYKEKEDETNSEMENDLLYQQDFLSFSKFFFVTLTLKDKVTLGYKKVIVKKIKKLLKILKETETQNEKKENNLTLKTDQNTINDKNSDSSCLFNFNSSGGEESNSILENENEDMNSSRDDSSNYNNIQIEKLNKTNVDINTNKNKSGMKNVKNLTLTNLPIVIKNNNENDEDYLDILNVNNIKLPEFLLFAAFVLETDKINCKSIVVIINLYETSFFESDKEFSYNKFYKFLDNINYLSLQNYYQKINNSKEYNQKIKMYLSIIESKLKSKNLNDSNEKKFRRRSIFFKSVKLNSPPESVKTYLKSNFQDENRITSLPVFENAISRLSTSVKRNSSNNQINTLFCNLNDISFLEKNTDTSSKESEGNSQLKINIINFYKKYKKTNKDPLQLIEEIGVSIYLFILNNSLHKIKPEIITSKLLGNLSNSEEFQPIKELVAELQVVNLKYLLNTSNEHKFTFWLNIFNFLMVFAVLYKKEILLTYYEWHKFKKNSFFNIGGHNFSLYEIENIILQNNYMSKILFSECIDFPKGDARNKFKIPYHIKYINFAISEPMTSSFKLQIYFPLTIEKQILKNAIDYFNSRIVVDEKKILVKLPEYLTWVDEKFLENIDYYKQVLNNDVYNFIIKNQDKVKIIKHDWSLNFSDSIV